MTEEEEDPIEREIREWRILLQALRQDQDLFLLGWEAAKEQEKLTQDE